LNSSFRFLANSVVYYRRHSWHVLEDFFLGEEKHQTDFLLLVVVLVKPDAKL
jgi:hypothetical protein